MLITLRAARPDDYGFAKQTYYETMRWVIERLFGWDEWQAGARLYRWQALPFPSNG